MSRLSTYSDLFIDFDDTLYDTHGNAEIALRELFAQCNLGRWFPQPDVFYREYWRANIDLWSRYSRGEISRDFLILERFRYPLSFGHGLQPTEAFCRHVGDLFLQLCADKPGLVEGARPLMEYLQSRGYRLHMCSNGFHEVQYKKLRACGLEPFFHTIVLSEDAGYNKPAPEFFDYALRVTGASRATTLMIGDNLQTDILGARRAGLATAFFNRYPQYPTSEPVDIEVTALSQLRHYL